MHFIELMRKGDQAYNLPAPKVITPARPVVQILINLNSDLISLELYSK